MARWLWIPAALVVLTLAGSGGSALAGTYSVPACNSAPGNVNHSWIASNDDAGHLATSLACPTAGVIGAPDLAGIAAGDLPGAVGPIAAGARAGWRFTAPAGTTITRLDYVRWLGQQAYNDKIPALRDAFGSVIGSETCHLGPTDDICTRGDSQASSPSAAISLGSLNTSELWFGVTCVPQGAATTCTDGFSLHEGFFNVYGATVTISETTAPTLGTVSGSLSSGGWLHGAQTVALATATDPSGIQSLALSVDGAATTSSTPLPPTCDFTFPKPCADLASSSSWSVDTATLADGAHTAQIRASNAAGVLATTSIPFQSDNTPPASPAVSSDVGSDWQAEPTAHLSWPLPGQGSGSPIASAMVQLCDGVGSACGVAEPADSLTSHTMSFPERGAYVEKVTLIDTAGNVGVSTSYPLRYDPTAPESPISSQSSADHWQPSRTVSLTWTAPPHADGTAPVLAARVQACSPEMTNCSSPTTIPGAASGEYVLPASEGIYALRLWLVSAAGASDPSTAVILPAFYSHTPPTTRIVDTSPTPSADPAFAATLETMPGGPAPIASVLWSLCQGSFCTSNGDAQNGQISATVPRSGTWTFSATPVDQAGVQGATVSVPFIFQPETGGGGNHPPNGGASPPRSPARSRLRISRAEFTRAGLAIEVRASLNLRVHVSFAFRASGRRRSVAVVTRLRHGHRRVGIRLSHVVRRARITVKFAGSPTTRAATVRRSIVRG